MCVNTGFIHNSQFIIIMPLIGIVARARNQAIGRGGTLPWRYPADLKFFKQQTTGHACVMGRRTWESLPKPLPRRLNIILSRSLLSAPPPSVVVLRHAAEVLSLQSFLKGDVFIIGGAEIYRAFAPHIEKWLVTEIPLTVPDADTFLPPDLLDGYEITDNIELAAELRVTVYERLCKAKA